MSFESIAAGISDETERGMLMNIASKYPQLKKFVEVGETAAPVLEKLAAGGVDPASELAKLPEWVGYRQNHWVQERNMYQQEAEAADRAAALETELNELRLKGADMTDEDFNRLLDARGVVTKDALKAELNDVVKTPTLMSAMGSQGARFQQLYSELQPREREFYEQFKENLPMTAIFGYMETNRVWDPQSKTMVMPTTQQAYEAVVGPRMMAKKESDYQEKIKLAKEEGLKEGEQKAFQSRGAPGVPTGGGGAKGMEGRANSFMSRIFGKRSERDGAAGGGRLGDGTASREGFEKFQEKRSGTTSV